MARRVLPVLLALGTRAGSCSTSSFSGGSWVCGSAGDGKLTTYACFTVLAAS